ncbi:hypothetical protein ARMSODRAFT_1078623 [Armillaria solidipes]|uniref:Uncharacterized protein n=1 Tax=Armillaria solidipes TaxID=1076256 RepID=A0A2H3CB83_9AGAR|nr:hypothetical protein ARMSODRAFT_1078623 [Armillaria solidipes]
MLRRQNECSEAFGGDPSLTRSFNLRSEYSGNTSLSISGRRETALQTGASSGSTSNGETRVASSSSNGGRDNPPSAASRSTFDSYSILGNRDFGGGDTSLGDGVRAGGDGIDIGFGTDSIKGKEDKGASQGGGSSTAGHHGSGHHTYGQGSNASPSQSTEGGKKSNSKDASGSGNGDNKKGSNQGAASNNAGGTASQNNGDGGKNTSPGDGSGYSNNSQNGSTGGGDNGGGVDSSYSSEPSPQTIPNTTPNPTNAQTRPAATSASIASNEGPDIMVDRSTSVESSSSLQSTLTLVGGSSYISSIGRNPTASLGSFSTTTATAMISPSGAGNTINTSTNSRGLVGGIIGGVIAFSALITLLVVLFVRKRRRLRIPSSLFNFDIERFVGAKFSAESVVEARVPTPATHQVSPTVVKWKPSPEWGDGRCDDDGVFRPTRVSRDKVANSFQDAAHARTSIISAPVPVVEDPFHDSARESRHAFRDSGTSSLAMSYEEGTVQEASRVPIQRLGSSVLSFDHDTFAIGPSVSDT